MQLPAGQKSNRDPIRKQTMRTMMMAFAVYERSVADRSMAKIRKAS
jgi:hypothetical protein